MIYSLKNAGNKWLILPLVRANAPNHPTLQLEAKCIEKKLCRSFFVLFLQVTTIPWIGYFVTLFFSVLFVIKSFDKNSQGAIISDVSIPLLRP